MSSLLPTRAVRLLAILIVAWIIIMAAFALARHNRLNSSAYDLAIYSQAVWNTSQGRPFASSFEVENLLGDHVQLILLLLAPGYWLWPDAGVLLVAQAIVLGLAAIPIYRLAGRAFPSSPYLPLAFALAYLLYPAVGFINRYDFHAIAFTIPILLFTLDALESGRPRLATALVLLALACNEEVGLTIFALGLYLALIKKQVRLGAAWAVLGLAWSLIALFVVIPAFRTGADDATVRYLWLGEDLPAIIRTVLTRPFYVLQHQLGDPLRQQFLFRLLLPVAFLSLLSPTLLAVGLPCLAYNLLSETHSQSSIYFHYISPLIPFIFAAAIQGALRLQGWLAGRSLPAPAVILTGLLLGTTAAWLLDNPFTTPVDEPHFPVYALEQRPDQAAFAQAKALLPPAASVSTTMAYASHVASRPILDLFYHKGTREDKVYAYQPTDYLLLNLTDLRWFVNPRVYYAMIETAIGRDGYQAVYFRDDVLLLTREPLPLPATGETLRRVIELEEAGGKYAPTAQTTLDAAVRTWLYPQLPAQAMVQAASFEAGLSLLGYTLAPLDQAIPGSPLCPTLYWQTAAPVTADYTVFLHLRDETGYVHAQRDNVPVLGFYPTTQWQTDTIIGDMHCFQIPPQAPAGNYTLVTGLYNPTSGQRLSLADGTADEVILTTLSIKPED
jgi:uncharacterized membrane protein